MSYSRMRFKSMVLHGMLIIALTNIFNQKTICYGVSFLKIIPTANTKHKFFVSIS